MQEIFPFKSFERTFKNLGCPFKAFGCTFKGFERKIELGLILIS